ncbi:hypothetical protein Lal_00010103, partial [Lupinus albus]
MYHPQQSYWAQTPNNYHIVSLYSHLQFWDGITTTRRSEYINSYIKKFVNVKTSLVNFVNQVGVVVNIQNQAGEEAIMCQKYHNPQVRTSFPIEEDAANILTHYAFEHVIQVLLKNDCFCLSKKYLPSRWRWESSLIPKSSDITNCNDNSSIEFLKTLTTKDRVVVATKELERIIELVLQNKQLIWKIMLMIVMLRIPSLLRQKVIQKGELKLQKKSCRCHFPNCGGTIHDSSNCPNKWKKDSLLSSQSPNKSE